MSENTVQETAYKIKAAIEDALNQPPLNVKEQQERFKQETLKGIAAMQDRAHAQAYHIGFANKIVFDARGIKSGYSCLITTDQGQFAAIKRGMSYRKLKKWAASKWKQLEGVMFVDLVYTHMPPVSHVNIKAKLTKNDALPIEDVADCCKEST